MWADREQEGAAADRRLDDILDPSYLDGVEESSTAELRRMRAECEEHERAVSYTRRVLQGRLDILRAELLSREERGGGAVESLLSRLPDILGHDHVATDPLQARATRLEVPAVAEPLERELDDIVDESRLDAVSEAETDELAQLIERLADHEGRLSTLRRDLFDRIDRLREELAARYKDGRANIGELLGTDRTT
jgi:glycosyltransferase involved in cell wall biosynthesis